MTSPAGRHAQQCLAGVDNADRSRWERIKPLPSSSRRAIVTSARRTPSNRASRSWVVTNSLLSTRSRHHQQPAGEPFVEPPAPICKSCLVALHHESVDVVQQGGSETLAAAVVSRSKEMRSADPADCTRSSLVKRYCPETTPYAAMPSEPTIPTSMRWLGFVTPTRETGPFSMK
jgi:hypothetical protein